MIDPDEGTEQERENDREREGHPGLVQQRERDAAQADDRADREVDTRGDDDERLSERDERPDGGLPDQVADVLLGKKRVGRERQHEPEEREQAEERELQQGFGVEAARGRRGVGCHKYRFYAPSACSKMCSLEAMRCSRAACSCVPTSRPCRKTCRVSLSSNTSGSKTTPK